MEHKPLPEQILDMALEIAECDSWENLHLYSIAQRLEISLELINQYFHQKDDIVEAWFDRADRAVLNIPPSPDFLNLSVRERLQHVIMTWLDTLAPHRRVTKQMLMYKLEFGHVHLQALGIMRISRTVQWFREIARINTTGFRRIMEETGTTAIYLMTFAKWINDESTGSHKTREFLEQSLIKAQQLENLTGII